MNVCKLEMLMRNLLLLCSIFLSLNSFSQSTKDQGVDIDQLDPNLSYKYQKGRFLLYDCKDNHWVCTKSIEFERCKKSRKKEILDGFDHFSCGHFRPFQSVDDCHKKQLKLTNQNLDFAFCHKTKLKSLNQ